jgi:hypothetical protein
VRILLTRPEGRNEQLAQALRTQGHDVVCEPLIAVEPTGDEPIELDGYDWLIVTSASGADELRRRARGRARGWRQSAERADARRRRPVPGCRPRRAARRAAAAVGPRPLRRRGGKATSSRLAADFAPLYRTRGYPSRFPTPTVVLRRLRR